MTKYKISYQNGNITQTLVLVPKDLYIDLIKPTEARISELNEQIDKCKKKDKEKERALKKERAIEKAKINDYLPYFVIGSPLYYAIPTGILKLPKTQGGEHIIIIKEVK